MQTLKGSLRMGPYSSGCDFGFHIELHDVNSRMRVLYVTLTPEQFGTMMANRHIEVNYEIIDKDFNLLGGEAQNKTEVVVVKGTNGFDKGFKAKARRALKKFEVDGWYARSGDIDNYKNYSYVGDETHIAVVFFRTVPPK